MLKVLVKAYGCLGSGTTVRTQVLCHSVLVHHLTGYSDARFGIPTGHCAVFSGIVCRGIQRIVNGIGEFCSPLTGERT